MIHITTLSITPPISLHILNFPHRLPPKYSTLLKPIKAFLTELLPLSSLTCHVLLAQSAMYRLLNRPRVSVCSNVVMVVTETVETVGVITLFTDFPSQLNVTTQANRVACWFFGRFFDYFTEAIVVAFADDFFLRDHVVPVLVAFGVVLDAV